MDAHGINLLPAGRAATWPRVNASAFARVLNALATTLLALVGLAGLLICARRLGGSLTEPLPSGALVPLGVGLGLAAALFRAACLAPSTVGPNAAAMRWAMPSLVVAIWCVGIATGQSMGLGLLAFLGLLVAEEALSWAYWRKIASRQTGPAIRSTPRPPREPSTAVLPDDDLGAGDALEPGVLARWIRSRQEDGRETIEGAVRVAFQTGERQTQAHLAICPPLAAVPSCFAEPTDGADAQVRVAQVLPYGVRLEVKLDQPAEEACDVTIGFAISERGDEGGETEGEVG
jgi:hypothetical protein